MAEKRRRSIQKSLKGAKDVHQAPLPTPPNNDIIKANIPNKTEYTQMDIEDYLRILGGLGIQEDNRGNYLGRLLVRAFEARLNSEESIEKTGRQFSREILPEFFTLLHFLLGHTLIERYQTMLKTIISRKNKNSKNFDWDCIYGDKDAQHIMLDSLAVMALHLENILGSSGKAAKFINGDFSAADKNILLNKTSIDLSQETFRMLLKDLFYELYDYLSTEVGRLRMTKRHGAETCVKLVDFVLNLY